MIINVSGIEAVSNGWSVSLDLNSNKPEAKDRIWIILSDGAKIVEFGVLKIEVESCKDDLLRNMVGLTTGYFKNLNQ